ncbi:probable valine--tRNA ligase, cytoplasmic isoform X2 [Diorhabda sublineata]|uniref:probable valine--tRNA ligase, cytoplasmic isoform X2 n=1 Tax=Diorhabda sublineata TaxID=1163346 RepID=UPI0024E13A51|nr:probable valine--tRNA ligase, cytoplasmic isoform X2 [Diorhabda sublineata]
MITLRIKKIQNNIWYSSYAKTKTLDQAYVPHKVECSSKTNYFKPPVKNVKPFSLVLPPPNITGTLHLGHALTATIQDVLIRWKQMQGVKTSWIPGMDHAGIATQIILEKLLWKENQQTRQKIGRDLFLEKVNNWKNEKSSVIRKQLERMGVLLDWDKEIFTLDQQRSKAVQEAFIRLFDLGLIYRADALVNWSCILKSAISDIEVEQLSINGLTKISIPGFENPVEFGIITKFAYLIDGTDEEIVVATTRMETMLGDVAVAVHPEDSRYSNYIGKQLKHPFRNDMIPVIADTFVDRDYGTGAVKITPAHNFTDYDVAKKHNLKPLSVIDESGNLTSNCGKFSGLPRFEARSIIAEELSKLGLFKGTEEHPMSIPICSRTKDVIEYLIRPQWFVDCKSMAAEAVRTVKEGSLSIEPKSLEKTWFAWLENIRDWCISRQLWWGHRVPAYSCSSIKSGTTVWVAAGNEQTAITKGAAQLGVDTSDIRVKRDEDVLDTWFSSGLLPFASFGWPDKTIDFEKFYPLSLMETGHDILFFWVARMVMLGIQLTDRLPFDKIFLHGIICDVYGRKMSKSLGNVVAPEDVIDGISLEEMEEATKRNYNIGILSIEEFERSIQGQRKMFPRGIPACGSDALRFTLLSHNVKNTFINFDVNECYTNKLFCNKIWQATKFTKTWYDNRQELLLSNGYDRLEIMDKWILSKLTRMVDKVIGGMENYDFYICTNALKKFLYFEFCDIYLETTKRGLRCSESSSKAPGHVRTLLTCLDVALRALGPFMPYLTEHLHSRLPQLPGEEKIFCFPQKLNYLDDNLEKNVEDILEIVAAIRRLKKIFNVSVKTQPKLLISTSSICITNNSTVIQDLTGFNDIEVSNEVKDDFSKNCLKDKIGETKIYLEMSEEIRKTLQFDLDKMEKKKKKLEKELEKIKKMVSGSTYKMNVGLEKREIHSKKIILLEEQLTRLDYLKNVIK